MCRLNQSIKKLSYSYDLVSGNVNEVIYQKGETDEFRHKYNYDADNRITNVFTSKDGVIYEQDTKYFYFDHGPLARTEIGHSKVQAMDYAYTIQGWIKSVNGEEIDEETMMGWDGAQAANSQVASTINKHPKLPQDLALLLVVLGLHTSIPQPRISPQLLLTLTPHTTTQ